MEAPTTLLLGALRGCFYAHDMYDEPFVSYSSSFNLKHLQKEASKGSFKAIITGFHTLTCGLTPKEKFSLFMLTNKCKSDTTSKVSLVYNQLSKYISRIKSMYHQVAVNFEGTFPFKDVSQENSMVEKVIYLVRKPDIISWAKLFAKVESDINHIELSFTEALERMCTSLQLHTAIPGLNYIQEMSLNRPVVIQLNSMG